MISALVVSYGYLAVFLGTLFEGETFLLAAGFAAHRGLLAWPWVVAVAFVGASLGDQLAFLLGRWRGAALIARHPALARRAPRVHTVFERHHVLFILSIRFIYGLRLAGPIVMGTSRLPFLRFALLDMLGAALWAPLIAGAGYLFGVAMEALLGEIQHIEEAALIGLLAAGFIVWLWRRRRAAPPR
ncbi:MAG TPA: DedA family protein [Rhodocyclaceae bacterium]|nr:DedA family protein [Rhodocyclaceae bacterium]